MRHRLGVLVAVALIGCGDNFQVPGDGGMDGSVSSLCGNGVVDPGEDCDDGASNGGSDPCDTTCHWTCLNDNYCDDGDPCNGMETCDNHVCDNGTGLADGTSCGTSKICLNMACTPGVCGDGFVTPPEECDDANSVNGD